MLQTPIKLTPDQRGAIVRPYNPMFNIKPKIKLVWIALCVVSAFEKAFLMEFHEKKI
jgi:hypothetical protein